MKKTGFGSIELICALALTGAAAIALTPPAAAAEKEAERTAAIGKAKAIYQAISKTNQESRQGSIWPRTGETTDPRDSDRVDIRRNTYSDSTEYFWDALDGQNLPHPDRHRPAIELSFDQLAAPGQTIDPKHGKFFYAENMWTIAANVSEDLPGFIPALISRNLDPSGLLLSFDGKTDAPLKLDPSAPLFKTPGFVMTRLDGSTAWHNPTQATLKGIYGTTAFDISTRKVSGQTLAYLTPHAITPPALKN